MKKMFLFLVVFLSILSVSACGSNEDTSSGDDGGDTNEEVVLKYLEDDDEVICVDEVQFLSKDIVKISEALADKGIRVIVAGLDRDFRGEPFGAMPQLLIHAEFVTKLSAVCNICGSPATRTQRIIDGKPAHYKDPIILVGAVESYEPRCRHCHEVLGAPKIKLKKV